MGLRERPKPTPLDAARSLARVKLLARRIPTTKYDFDPAYHIHAYEMCQIVQEQAGCTFRAAARAVSVACPTLFA